MAKKTERKPIASIMFLGAILVILTASLIILTSGKGTPTPVEAMADEARMMNMETPEDMMNVLGTTIDDGGVADLEQLKNATSGL